MLNYKQIIKFIHAKSVCALMSALTLGVGCGDDASPAMEAEQAECCINGSCICLGSNPTEITLDAAGPFDVQSYSDGFPSGTDYKAGTIYYPGDAPGPLSVLAMCPGFTATQSTIASWGPFFASHGFAIIIIDTLTTGDGVELRDDALLGALEAVRGENTRAGSPLEGMLGDRFGVSGWSMGGGGSWLAGSADPNLKSVMALAGHHRTVSSDFATTYAAKITVPTAMIAGSADTGLLGGGGQSQAAYAAIPDTTPKFLYEMTGVTHYEFGTPTTHNNALGRYALAFQKTFLDGDERYRKFLLAPGPDATDWQSNLIE